MLFTLLIEERFDIARYLHKNLTSQSDLVIEDTYLNI